MLTLKQIAVVDECWGIGREGRLLFSIPEDMRFFRQSTLGKPVIMGHHTLLTLPGGRPLQHRRNIVLSRRAGLRINGAIVCPSLEALAGLLAGAKEAYVIGGSSVYAQLLPHCAAASITHVAANGHADRFYPRLTAEAGWALQSESAERRHKGLRYRFCEYTNSKPLPLPGPEATLSAKL